MSSAVRRKEPQVVICLHDPKGEEAARQLTGIFHGVEAAAASDLSEGEVAELKELLTKLCDSMQAQAAGKKVEK